MVRRTWMRQYDGQRAGATGELCKHDGFRAAGGTTGPYGWAWEIKSVNGTRPRHPRAHAIRLRRCRRRGAAAFCNKLSPAAQCQPLSLCSHAAARPASRSTRMRSRRDRGAGGASAKRQGRSGDARRHACGARRRRDRGSDPEEVTAALHADLRTAITPPRRALVAARQREGAARWRRCSSRSSTRWRASSTPPRRSPARTPRGHPRSPSRAGRRACSRRGARSTRTGCIRRRCCSPPSADIREELDRLRAHVAARAPCSREGGAVGRRLDFLAQEFDREANTLCSKSNDVSLSRDRPRPQGGRRPVPRAGAERRVAGVSDEPSAPAGASLLVLSSPSGAGKIDADAQPVRAGSRTSRCRSR